MFPLREEFYLANITMTPGYFVQMNTGYGGEPLVWNMIKLLDPLVM